MYVMIHTPQLLDTARQNQLITITTKHIALYFSLSLLSISHSLSLSLSCRPAFDLSLALDLGRCTYGAPGPQDLFLWPILNGPTVFSLSLFLSSPPILYDSLSDCLFFHTTRLSLHLCTPRPHAVPHAVTFTYAYTLCHNARLR